MIGKDVDMLRLDEALTGMQLVECEADERREVRAVERGDLLSGRHGRPPCCREPRVQRVAPHHRPQLA